MRINKNQLLNLVKIINQKKTIEKLQKLNTPNHTPIYFYNHF
mgnify:CR=1 FL=1